MGLSIGSDNIRDWYAFQIIHVTQFDLVTAFIKSVLAHKKVKIIG